MNFQNFSVKKIQSLGTETWEQYEKEIINRLYQLASFGVYEAQELLNS